LVDNGRRRCDAPQQQYSVAARVMCAMVSPMMMKMNNAMNTKYV
jgi:hypothetical protein